MIKLAATVAAGALRMEGPETLDLAVAETDQPERLTGHTRRLHRLAQAGPQVCGRDTSSNGHE